MRERDRNTWRGLAVLALAAVIGFGGVAAEAKWSFGVMSDTQWKSDLDGENPGTCAVGIATQVQQAFMDHGVDFVVQVGDLVDSVGTNGVNENVRAAAAQQLYDAGVGFYPMRGNHDDGQASALLFQANYPQTRGQGANVGGAANFSSPFETLNGLSYAFTYENARFVMIDQFRRADNTGSTNNNLNDQVGWVNATLGAKPANGHAFVFAHKNLIGGNHTDVIFGSNPASNIDTQNAFIGALDANGVRYYNGGHDHMHHRSLVASPDGQSSVQQIITSSNSYKFYVPTSTPRDVAYNNPPRETMIEQELFTVGYYVYTVDGPRVTVEHWAADPIPETAGLEDIDLTVTPDLDFRLRETFGYSLNGKETFVAQGSSYAMADDTNLAVSLGETGYVGTTMAILNGANGSTRTDHAGRALTKAVNTGWTARGDDAELFSDVLSLWGMGEITPWGTEDTDGGDAFVLSLSYTGALADLLDGGEVALRTRDANGNWILAVAGNVGGTATFVGDAAYDPAMHGLGSYGYDSSTYTAWAVINHNSDFAVAVPEPATLSLLALSGLALIRRRR